MKNVSESLAGRVGLLELYPLSNRAFRQFLIDFPGAALIISHDRMVINEVATKVYKLTNNGLELVK